MTPTPGIDGIDEPSRAWHVSVVVETGSTNDDMLRAAEDGGLADRSVLRTDHQTSGRGRLDRRWDAPPGSNLLASIYLAEPGDRPGAALQRVGVAIVDALLGLHAAQSTADPEWGSGPELSAAELRTSLGLKWPNDVLLGGRKLAGILAQRSTTAQGLVVGFGVNVGWSPPEAAQVSEVVDCRPVELLDAVLTSLDALPVDHATFTERYRRHLLTLGQRVRIHLPGDTSFDGLAVDVDVDGRIVVRSDASSGPLRGVERTFDVGDVVHLRPGPHEPQGPAV